MTATERSPYRPARASKREFGLLDAGFISDTIGPGRCLTLRCPRLSPGRLPSEHRLYKKSLTESSVRSPCPAARKSSGHGSGRTARKGAIAQHTRILDNLDCLGKAMVVPVSRVGPFARLCSRPESTRLSLPNALKTPERPPASIARSVLTACDVLQLETTNLYIISFCGGAGAETRSAGLGDRAAVIGGRYDARRHIARSSALESQNTRRDRLAWSLRVSSVDTCVAKNSSFGSGVSHKIGEADLQSYASICAMISPRMTDLLGKAAIVTGARPPDLITMGKAGSCLVDRAPPLDA